MTKIQNCNVLIIEYLNLRFIWNLVLVIWNFRGWWLKHEITQSHAH